MSRVVRRLPRRFAIPRAARYTVDASVFVNAFNQHERGHAQSFEFLTETQERGDPIIVPTLLAAEIASAIARTVSDAIGAMDYASTILTLPHLTLVSLTPATARRAAELAATHRLRGADSLYLEVAQRYATTLVSRDNEQLTRGAAIAVCQTPEDALSQR